MLGAGASPAAGVRHVLRAHVRRTKYVMWAASGAHLTRLWCCCRLEFELVQTAHSEKVSDLAFPAGYGEVFATASVGCIRVWHLLTCRELLRINVPNLTCNCVIFAPVSQAGLACQVPSLTTLAVSVTSSQNSQCAAGPAGADGYLCMAWCAMMIESMTRAAARLLGCLLTTAGPAPTPRASGRQEHHQRLERWQGAGLWPPERQAAVHHQRRAPQGRHRAGGHLRQQQGHQRRRGG